MMVRLPIEIRGTGSYVPEQVLPNEHFIRYLDTDEEWIVTRTGIRERRKAAPEERTSTMAVKAAQTALDNAGMSVSEIDLILCATATGDCPFPATATFIQGALGACGTPAFDVAAACAGFLHALIVGASMVISGLYKNVLVIGAETLTRYGDPEDRRTVVLLGDGAGAAILRRSADTDRGILYCDMGCEGSLAELIWVPAGGSRKFTCESTVAERLHYMRMRGREVYKFAVVKMQELIDHALTEAGLAPEQLKMVIPHQSNLRIIESVREKMGLPKEKMAVNIDRYGNTSAASVIMALDEHRRKGTLGPGDVILMIAIGAGLTWSTVVMRL